MAKTRHQYWRSTMYYKKPWYKKTWKDLDRMHWLLLFVSLMFGIITLYQVGKIDELTEKNEAAYRQVKDFLSINDLVRQTNENQFYEIRKLKNHVAELEAVESRSTTDIKDYILKYYKKTPPSVANELAETILEKSTEYDVPFVAVVGVMEVESGFNPRAVSTAGARGPMQVMYNIWGKKFKLGNKYALHDIETGTESGIRVLREYLDDTKNNMRKALYKYLGGRNPMKKRFKPSPEQDKYAKDVYEAMGRFVMYRSFAAMSDETEEKNGQNGNEKPIETIKKSYYHTIQYQGESLSLIAKWYTGKTSNWRKIAEKNPELNPLRIKINHRVLIPEELLTNRTPMGKDFVRKNMPRKKKEIKRETKSDAGVQPIKPLIIVEPKTLQNPWR